MHHTSEPWRNTARLVLRTFRAGGSPPSAEGVMHSYGQKLLCPRTQTAMLSQHRPRNDHRGERLCADRWAPHGSEPGASVTPPAGLPPCPRQPVPPWSLRHCCQRACSLRLGGATRRPLAVAAARPSCSRWQRTARPVRWRSAEAASGLAMAPGPHPLLLCRLRVEHAAARAGAE